MRRRARGSTAAVTLARPTAARASVGTLAVTHAVKILALGWFASGFLLSRRELADRSRVAWSDGAVGGTGVDKVVALVVDGGRYEWTRAEGGRAAALGRTRRAADACDGGEDVDGTDARGRGVMFKFIADAPTTTQQRLKGLLTGGLPTFIDASDSFGGTSLREDNVIEQLRGRGMRMAISGDDTWGELFDVNATFSSGARMLPSFDVKDLHTVDDGVRAAMSEALKRPEDWDVLIGHMLGADHVGHTHGATGSHMRAKLEENDRDIQNVVDAMRADKRYANSMLFVFGDHGMTDNGDHGGGTAEEVESFLLAYHPWATRGVTCSKTDDDLPQIDFAPTLAAITGVPTPYGNLGKVNEKIFRLAHEGASASSSEWVEDYVRALRANVEQVWNYVQAYGKGKTSPFGADHFERLEAMIESARKSGEKARFVDFLNEVADLARARWASFKLVNMALGFIVLVAAVVAYAVAAYARVRETNGIRFGGIDSVVGLIVVSLAAAARLSNSFILAEQQVTQFLFGTLMLAVMARSTSQPGIDLRLVMKGGLQCLFANAALNALGSNWVKSDASRTVSSFFAAMQVILGFALIAAYFPSARRHTSMKGCDGTFRAIDIASCAWASVAIRNAQILIWGVDGTWLALATYALSTLAVIANALDVYLAPSTTAVDIKRGWVIFGISMLPLIALLAGPAMGVPYVACACVLFRGIIDIFVALGSSKGSDTTLAITLWLATNVLFFGGGHKCSFDGLHFAAAFTGFHKFNFYLMGFLLGFETWSSEVLLATWIPLIAMEMTRKSKSPHDFERFMVSLATKIALCRGIMAAFATLCAALHRRHLMVWAIFAPKFVFDAIGTSVGDFCTLLSVVAATLIARRRATKTT